MYLEDSDAGIQPGMEAQPAGSGMQDDPPIVADVDAGFGKWRKIWGTESVERGSIDFCRPVAPHEL